MRISALTISLSLIIAVAPPLWAEEKIGLAVMEFEAKGGMSQLQVDALGDLLASEVRNLGRYQVIGKSDIRGVLRLEEKKALLGCSDDSCLAEIGGALGVGWMVSGNVSGFGDSYLLNLKLMDVKNIRVVARYSRKVSGDQADLLDSLPAAVRALFSQAPKTIRPGAAALATTDKTMSTWGHVTFWSGLGLAALGGVSLWQASVAADDYTVAGSSSAADRNAMWNGIAPTGLVVGGILMFTGTMLWTFAPSGPRPRETVSLGASPTGDGSGLALGLSGSF